MSATVVYKCKGLLQRRVEITEVELDKTKYCCVRYPYTKELVTSHTNDSIKGGGKNYKIFGLHSPTST